MIEFNLLPWRAAKRNYESKLLKWIAGVAIAMLSCQYFAGHALLVLLIERATQQLAEVKQELEQELILQKKFTVKEASVSADAVKALTTYQEHTQELFHHPSLVEPPSVCFTSIVRDKDRIVLAGEARSAAELMSFLQQWQVAKHFSVLDVQKLQQSNAKSVMQFRISATELVYPFQGQINEHQQ